MKEPQIVTPDALSGETNQLFRPKFRLSPPLICFLTAFVLFSIGTIGTEITAIDVRFAIMAQDMARHSLGIFMTVNGVEYTDYPSGWMLFSYLSTLGGRFVNLWTLTLPSLLAGSYLIATTCAIGERYKRGIGICAASILFLTMEFLNIIMSFGIDVPIAALGVALLARLERKPNATLNALLFAVALIAGFAIRGPLGVILIGAATAAYLAVYRRWKEFILCGAAGAVVAVGCAAIGYKLILLQGGEDLWNTFREWQITSRMGDSEYLYYFSSGIVSFAPATIMSILCLIFCRRNILSSPLLGYLAFMLASLILLSIPGCKHLRYAAIALAPCALIAGYWVACEGESLETRILQQFFSVLELILLPVAALGFLAIITVGLILTQARLLPWGHWVVAALFLLALFTGIKRCTTTQMRLTKIAAVTAVMVTVAVYPLLAALGGSYDFVTKVEPLRRGNLSFFLVGPDHDDLKYVLYVSPEKRSELHYLYKKERDPRSPYARMYSGKLATEQIPLLPAGEIVIARSDKLESFRKLCMESSQTFHEIQRGKLGRKEYVAVEINPR
ncbi:MAG: hypothetical protein LBM70_07205 [Victivallales bacterium]|jgi:4-amino-4-deoxy-L-arabinose transferase-like glycosyltransferase|nr:hypothetical protein [Victivallales bacterium]